MSGQQLRGDGGGDASRQSEEQYRDANSELHDRAPFASADSRPHPGTQHEPTPAGALWPFPRAARALVGRVGDAAKQLLHRDAPSQHVSSPRPDRETGDTAVGTRRSGDASREVVEGGAERQAL